MKPDKRFPEVLPVGSRVRKNSGLPFKSRLKVNTVSGYCTMTINGAEFPAYNFEEDESHVEAWRCQAATQEDL